MSWLEGLLGLGQVIAGQNIKPVDYPEIPPSKGLKTTASLLKYALTDMLSKYTGAPLEAVSKYSDLTSKYPDLFSGIEGNIGKYSGATAFQKIYSQEPEISRAIDLRSAIVNRQLGDTGRRMAMGLKLKKRSIKLQDLQDLLTRRLQELQNELLAKQYGRNLAMGGMYNIGLGLSDLYSNYFSNPSLEDINVGNLAGVLGGGY